MANEHGRFKCARRLMASGLGRSRPTLSAVSSLPFHYESTKTNRKEAYSSMAKI